MNRDQSPLPPSVSPADGGTRKTLLIVEDDPLVRTAVETALKKAGYRTLAVSNGREAVQRLGEHGVDLVITDLCMPGMDGVELVIHLRKSVPAVPVIAVSGASAIRSDDMLRAAKLLGASMTLEKPFSVAGLVEAVRQLVGPSAPKPKITG